MAIKAEFNTLDLVEMANVETMNEVKTENHVSNVQSSGMSHHQTPQPQLNDRERERLEELYVASRSLVEPMEHERDVIFYTFSFSVQIYYSKCIYRKNIVIWISVKFLGIFKDKLSK